MFFVHQHFTIRVQTGIGIPQPCVSSGGAFEANFYILSPPRVAPTSFSWGKERNFILRDPWLVGRRIIYAIP